MFKILSLGLLIPSLYATTLEVKKADVKASINTQEIVLKKGTTQKIEEGSTICYLEGKGKLLIPEYKRQLKKAGRCFMVPLSESTARSYANSLKNMATVAFWDSTESVRHGAGTKGEVEFDNKDSILLAKDQKEVLIYGNSFGPLPVVVLLKDKNGQEVLSYENEESETTIVRINRKYIDDGMSLEIYNGFEELLVSKKITKEL